MQKLPGKERGAAISCCIDSYQPFDGTIRAIFQDVTFKSHTDVLVFIVFFFPRSLLVHLHHMHNLIDKEKELLARSWNP